MTTTSNGTASSDSTDLAGVLRLEDDLPAVHFERLFRTDAADLWTSVTDPERLARWFQPVSGDLQAGGAYRIDFGEDSTTGVIQTCDAPSSFAVMWDFTGEPTSLLSVQVREHPDGAVLVLDHSRMPQEQGAGHGAGWQAHLDALDAELTGTAAGDWSQRWSGLVGDYRERLDALRRSHSGTSTGWLLGSREAPVVRVERVLAASIDDVWSACTEPDRLARWLATVDAPSLVVGEAVTVRLGAANGPGEGSPASWQVRRLDAPTLIELGWDDESDHGGTLTIQLEDVSPDASHTRLVLVHALAEAPGAIDQAADLDLYDELLPGYTEQARRLAGPGELDSTA